MRAKSLPILILALSLCAVGQTAPPAEGKINPDRISISEEYGVFQIDPDYDHSSAYAGGTVRLKITATTVAINHPENIRVVECTPEGSSSPIRIEKSGAEQQNRPGFLVTDYFFDVTIDPLAEPRNHRINLALQYLKNEVVNRFFNLKVGVRTGGKLIVIQDEEDLEPPTFFTGENGSLRLTLKNTFPDYTVNITRISVESIPGELVEYADNALTQPSVSLKPSTQMTVVLNFKVNRMDFMNLIQGFGDSPKLKLNVTYNDGFDREISDFTHKLNVKIRPRDRVLVMAMLAGVLIGGSIRFYLEFLARSKKITRRELLKFVLFTVIFGMVVTAFALFGKIQVVAFKTSGSYDKPMAIFIIGLAGAVGGLQLFVGWYNSLKPATGEAKQQTTKRRRRRAPTQEE